MYRYYKELEQPGNFKSLLNKSYEGKEEDVFEYRWPKSWYITPNGYLYNSGGDTGHKEGNLVYPFKRVFKKLFFILYMALRNLLICGTIHHLTKGR